MPPFKLRHNSTGSPQESKPLLSNTKLPLYSETEPHVLVSDQRFSTTSHTDKDHYPHHIEVQSTSMEHSKKSRSTTIRIDKGAMQFGLRMAVLLTLSSLFILVKTDNYQYPDGMWVLVSVLFVCWFPTLDAASVIEKIIQRLIGTFVGAFFGLGCGFLSLFLFETRTLQATFLAFCMFLFNFLIIWLAGQCKVGQLKVIKRFAYATILCVLTFCICMLPFGVDEDPRWLLGVIRIINVIVGCILGAVGSMIVCPRSTTDVLRDKTARQVKLAGEASEAVLHMASDFFAGRIAVNRLADELLDAPLESTLGWRINRSDTMSVDSQASTSLKADVALKKYEDAITDWKASKMLFPLTKYDPFHQGEDSDRARACQTEIARTLARALRLQTTIVVLDGMVRNDADYDLCEDELVLFTQTGTFIRQMLTLPLQPEKGNAAAEELFDKLEEIRKYIVKMSAAVSVADEETVPEPDRDHGIKEFQASLMADNIDYSQSTRSEEDDFGRGIPKNAMSSSDNSLFFLQLVEHLILRSLRLYQAWKQVEGHTFH